MVVLRSGREINSSRCSSSIANKSYHISKPIYASNREELIASRERAFANLGFKKVPIENLPNPDPNLQLAEEALNYFNQHSPQKYKLLELHSVKPTLFGRFVHFHINFTAENTHVAAAPKEMFFTELTNSPIGVSVRLCKSLGPKNSLSGEKLNGCCFCRNRNNVWHPSSGGFVRGNDRLYKTVQGICDINQNNATPAKHLPRASPSRIKTAAEHMIHDEGGDQYVATPLFKHVFRSRKPKNEYEYVSEQVDDASLYATEALKFLNQGRQITYGLVKPGFVTRVILPTCLLFHVNFTAKYDTDDATVPEEIFFAEMTSSSGVLSCKMLRRILKPELISGEKLNGCCFCRDRNNVWHPSSGGFVRGADELYMTVQGICDINRNNATPAKQLPRPPKQVYWSRKPKNEYEYVSEQVDDASLYATEALKFLNQGEHITYGLVKPGFVTRVILPTCLLFHVNFTAKYTDDATAPEEIFFAEMTSTSGVLSCKLLRRILKSELISGDETVDKTNGCYFCHKFNNVPHPIRGGFVRGGDSVYISEKVLEETQLT